jgi:hypothetical protein
LQAEFARFKAEETDMQAAVNAENARAAMLESNAHAKEQFIATQKQVWRPAVLPNGTAAHHICRSY